MWSQALGHHAGHALDAGVNFVDTADIHGKDCWDTPCRGASEERHLRDLGAIVILGHELSALATLKIAPEYYE